MGHSKPNKEAQLDFQAFAKVCKKEIQSRFKLEAQRRKAQLICVGQFRTADVKMPQYLDGNVFKTFRKIDVDKNGFLEWNEYAMCFETLSELGMTAEEILTVVLLADIDGTGRIDYSEFMKHFESIVFLIKFHNELQAHYDELPERLQERLHQNQMGEMSH